MPEDLDPVTGSLVDIVEASARDYPDAPALQFFGRETSYRELQEEIERAAAGLADLGVGARRSRRDRAAELPAAHRRVLRDPAARRRRRRAQPALHAARAAQAVRGPRRQDAIVWSKVVATVQEFPADLAVTQPHLGRRHPGDAVRARALALRLPIAKARESRDGAARARQRHRHVGGPRRAAAPLPASHPKPATDDLALIQYTSGTTGTPKGAALTHRNLLSNAAQARAWVPSIVRGDGCVVYAVLPMFHAYGLTLCLTFAMSMGARLVLFPQFDPDMVLAVTKKHPATFLPLVPPIADRLLKAAQREGRLARGHRRSRSRARWRSRTNSSCRSRRRPAATSWRATA